MKSPPRPTPVTNLIGGAVSKDIRHAYKPSDLSIFKRLGYADAAPLARGMEAATYVLSDELIGKVWGKRTTQSVTRLKRFYEELARCELPFATPLILQVYEVEESLVTVEKRIYGTPFSVHECADDINAMSQLMEALDAIASVDLPSARSLPPMDEQQSPWSDASNFAVGLRSLLNKRVDRFGDQLRLSVERFDEKVDAIQQFLERHSSSQSGLFHGDLCGGNVLIDEDTNIVGVLDFGFLTGVGDAEFDATITSAVYDMWSSRAQLRQHQFDTLLERRFGYDLEHLLVLRAAYAVIIANAYDPKGEDGQFWWSSTLLNRPDIHDLLLRR
jgi:aminoglycoside phosphotransferase (APT) family kinase protein